MSRGKRGGMLNIDRQLLVSLILFVALSALVLWLNRVSEVHWTEFVVVMNHALINVLIFGIFLVWLEKKRRQQALIKQLSDQLEDFKFWRTEEGIWRKIGLIKRMSDAGHPLPDLTGIELESAVMQDTVLQNHNLQHSNLNGAFLWHVDISGSNLSFSNLEKIYLESAVAETTKFCESYIALGDFREAAMKGADFYCANLKGTVFNGADLRNARFDGAYLEHASFRDADLSGASCQGGIFTGADFTNANLDGIDLRGADLRGCSGLVPEQMTNVVIDAGTHIPNHLWEAVGGRKESGSDAPGTKDPQTEHPEFPAEMISAHTRRSRIRNSNYNVANH